MMTARTIRIWSATHKWTSLICTAFMLLLCLTGLPLIFHHELDHLLGNEVEPPEMAAGTPHVSLDTVIAAAKAQRPGDVIQYVGWDPDEPDIVFVSMAKTVDAPPSELKPVVLDARTAKVLNEPKTQEGFMYVMFTLHVDLFAGLPGKLFLGAMGLLLVVAIISGVVLYAPFMRKLTFGTVRVQKSRRLKWLDTHNLLGVVTLVWALVVGFTGVINTWADLVIQLWRYDQLATMVAPYQGKPPVAPDRLASLDRVVATAREATPGMTPSFIAFPGTLFSSAHHHMVAMRGNAPLTKRLIRPVLVDGETAALTDTRELPWYLTALLVSQPLHFGDYGGMPMKIIWALLDIVTIIVLGSGLYLWVARRRTSVEARLGETVEEDRAIPDLTPAPVALRRPAE
nr:PepSY domain-containing protein [Reyranella sp. CPCC 100927]